MPTRRDVFHTSPITVPVADHATEKVACRPIRPYTNWIGTPLEHVEKPTVSLSRRAVDNDAIARTSSCARNKTQRLEANPMRGLRANEQRSAHRSHVVLG
jgi:hypothetical protein